MILKSGKYGPYIQRGEGGEDNTASVPDTIAPADLKLETALEVLKEGNKKPESMYIDEETGKAVTLRTGRFGPYLQLGEDGDETFKSGKAKKSKKVALTWGPKRTPIAEGIDPLSLSEADAKKVMTLPRSLGKIDGVEVIANIGRFGPYLKKDDDFRSLHKEFSLFTVTLADAEKIYAEPKKGRGGRVKKVLKDLGKDPKTEKPIEVLDGKYGPYISNGTKTFVSLPENTKPEDMTLEKALELIKEKKKKK